MSIHPSKDKKVPKVNTHLLGTSDSCQLSAQDNGHRGGGGQPPLPRLMSLEPETRFLVTEGWGPASEDAGRRDWEDTRHPRALIWHRAGSQERGF